MSVKLIGKSLLFLVALLRKEQDKRQAKLDAQGDYAEWSLNDLKEHQRRQRLKRETRLARQAIKFSKAVQEVKDTLKSIQ